ncbi:tetraspanin family protein [Bacillus subtilis subsp. subtilis]|nr:tetraspanin family protein [Bacillus subtilis subsp. subtilis]
MSSPLPPQLPNAQPPVDPLAPPKFLSPMVKSVLLVCVVSALGWGIAALVAGPLSIAAWLQDQVETGDVSWLSPPMQWLGVHTLGISVAMLLTCLVGVVACVGMLRREAWALWLFIVLLVVTALFNVVAAWVVDDAFAHLSQALLRHGNDPDMRQLRNDLLVQRIFMSGMLVLTALGFAVLHGWVAMRLLRADVRAWFQR